MASPKSVEQEPRSAKGIAEGGYLFVLPWSLNHVGGVNQVVRRLYEHAAAASDFCPYLMVTCWRREDCDANVHGIDQFHFRMRDPWPQANQCKGLVGFVLTLPGALIALVRLLRSRRIQVVNCHFPTLGALSIASLVALGLFRGKFLISLHGAEIAHAATTVGIERLLWRWLLSSADALIVCSAWLRSKVLSFEPSLGTRVWVVHNGADLPPSVHAMKQSVGSGPNGRKDHTIVSVGKFEHKKGHDVLLAAFTRLLEQGYDVRLVLIGASGPCLAAVKESIESNGLRSRVDVHVDLPHQCVWQHLETANLFVLSSRVEPFGIVLLEAGLAGVPVVATRVGGVTEILKDDFDSRLVEPGDPDALAAGMAELLDCPVKASVLASRLREHVLSNFSWARCYERYVVIACAQGDAASQDPVDAGRLGREAKCLQVAEER